MNLQKRGTVAQHDSAKDKHGVRESFAKVNYSWRMAMAGWRILINNQLYKYIDIFIIFYCYYNYYTHSSSFYQHSFPATFIHQVLHGPYTGPIPSLGEYQPHPPPPAPAAIVGSQPKKLEPWRAAKKHAGWRLLLEGYMSSCNVFFGIVWVISCVISNQYRNGLMLELK